MLFQTRFAEGRREVIEEFGDGILAIDGEVDWLSRLTPNNIDEVWEGFRESGFSAMPELTYDPLDIDLGDIRRRK